MAKHQYFKFKCREKCCLPRTDLHEHPEYSLDVSVDDEGMVEFTEEQLFLKAVAILKRKYPIIAKHVQVNLIDVTEAAIILSTYGHMTYIGAFYTEGKG